MPLKRAALLCAAAVMTAGCGESSTEPTEEENRELDRAGEMLDRAPASLNQVEDAELANAAAEPGEER